MKRVLLGLLILGALTPPRTAAAQELSVAAASDLTLAMGQLIPGYERASGRKVRLSTGSSGNLFTQIENGAPFDVFLSADSAYPRQLVQAGLAEPDSFLIYAVGKIVLWVRNDSQLEVSRGWAVLADPRVKKIAIANPMHAPYGRAAEAALRSAGVYNAVKNRLVFGENISQTAQFVESGNADIGVLALSLVVGATMNDHGKWWLVPEGSYPRLEQAAIILRSSRQKEAARAFLAYIRSPEARAILRRNGFAEPPGAGGQP